MGICVVVLETKANKLIILSLYRAPIGDFNLFIKDLNDTLKYMYKPKAEFLICGTQTQIISLIETKKKKKALLLTTSNLLHFSKF